MVRSVLNKATLNETNSATGCLLNDLDLLVRQAVEFVDELVDLFVGCVNLAMDGELIVVWFRYNPRSAPLCVIYSMRAAIAGRSR